jgi:lauroyl/myristoyl acyltransferase
MLKIRIKDAVGCVFFHLIRRLERVLSPRRYYSLLQPFFGVRAVFNTILKKPGFAEPRPDFLRVTAAAQAARRERLGDYLNHIIEFFPERLAGEKWLSRCRFEGLERLQRARQNGRPVVLAFCHFGPYYLLRFWLRAAGIPAATLVRGKSGERLRVMRLKDRLSPFPEIFTAFYQDQLRELAEFIAAGNVLLVSIDAPAGRQLNLPVCEGWTFQMATGAIRLASRHQAELLPCSIIDEGCWRFCLHIGQPIPRELLAPDSLTSEAGWSRAGKYLLDELTPSLRSRPEQCRLDFIRRLKPDP